MQYAIRSRGKGAGDNDYRWQFPSGNSCSLLVNGRSVHEFLGANGVLLYQNADETCKVFLLSRPHENVLDYQSRGIRIGLLVSECPIPLAKGLFAYALEHLDNYLADFQSFIINFGQDNWKIDHSAIEKFMACVIPIEPTGQCFTQRVEKNCSHDNCKSLLDSIKRLDWDAGEGFKLVVDNGIMTGSNLQTIRSQANYYLAEKSSEIILGKIKPDGIILNHAIDCVKNIMNAIINLSASIKDYLLYHKR